MFEVGGVKKRAVAYYRHSAEDKQENSVPIQREQAVAFASKYDIEIIHEEADEGKSGLSAARPGFERLFSDWVLNSDSPSFDYVFVLDVTRWGRFQDPDEAAYWEMQCKKRGIKVIYITKGFPREEEKLLTSLETSIGRYMAAEYSRQLSDKVWQGSMKVSEQGFSAGGRAPYGYVRVLLDEHKKRKGVLKSGEHKVIANQRVTFEPATDGTEEVVKEIFRMLVDLAYTPTRIAEELNKKSIRSATGRDWDSTKIIRVLDNETYTGTKLYNKTWSRLKQKQRKNPTAEWVRCEGAFEALVDRETFTAAQERLYWMMTSRWKHGIYQINKTQRALMNHTKKLIADSNTDRRYEILRKLPVSFGLTYYQGGVAKRCFRITEEMRQYPEVLGVSVDMFARDKVEAIFALPTQSFNISNYWILHDSDDLAMLHKVERNAIDKQILTLCDAVA